MSKLKDPVEGLTTRHILYLIFMHTIGAMFLDGGINFGLATAMYKNTKDPVMLWPLPNTLAGDAAVTIIIQTTLTWILDRLAVGGDLKKGLVAPLKTPKHAKPWLRWFVGLDELHAHQSRSTNSSLKDRILFNIAFHGKRILVMILATFILFWPITIGILSGLKKNGVGKDFSQLGGDFNVWPMPSIFKGIYGFATGITTPFVSYIALIYHGETMTKIDNRDYNQVQNNDYEDDPNSPPVIMEDLQQSR
ncbi:hypothetical protein BGZ94_009067 [Podila epigama]|nr:hypothetical protein BGZ94_009067 [Podila epigama]